MTTMTTTDEARAWLPEDVGTLVVQPVQAASVAIQVMGSVLTDGAVNSYRVPIVKTDPTASWVGEGEEITETAADLDEDADTFHKLAGLTVVSRELADDTNPSATEQIGLGLSRDLARRLDSAFFGTRAENTKAPRGLGDIKDVNAISAGSTFSSLDPFTDAIYAAESVGATLAGFVANPTDALAVAKIKDQAGSQRNLLSADPTQPGRRLVSGVPIYSSPAVAAGTIWGLPSERIVIPMRTDPRLDVDESVFFTSDRVAIRATLRVTFLYPHPAAIQKITTA